MFVQTLFRLGHYTRLALKNTVGELLTNIKVIATRFVLSQGVSTLTETRNNQTKQTQNIH